MPMIAPIADAIMQGAGYQKPHPGGDDPNFPTPAETAAMNMASPSVQGEGAAQEADAAPEVHENTSPAFPPVPQDAGTGMHGIETSSIDDNLR